MTMPRSSRADRRREGLLPSGEDPMVRRPPPRPAGGPPPMAGRRRTDADPTAAPGRPPATGERRSVQSPPDAEPRTQVSTPAGTARPAPAVPRPAPSPAVSGPMTAAAPPAGRALPPSARPADAAPPLSATAASPDAAPRTTGMPSWAAEPAPPPEVTQRVSGAAPAQSPWGSGAAQAPPPAAPAQPRRPAPAVPALTRAVPERPAAEPVAEPVAEPEPARNRAEVPVGGRAAARIERQAAEAARKKSGRRTGPPSRSGAEASTGPAPTRSAPVGPAREADPAESRRVSRGVLQGLLAIVVIAVGVLGFWSFTSPKAQETAAESPATSSAPASTSAPAVVQDSVAPSAEVTPPAPAGPVRVPVTVLNSTSINGLAGDISDAFVAQGWDIAGTDASPVSDVATTTAYYTEGDTVGQQAATQLIEQFPDISGPAPLYFDLPDAPPSGIVVVATGNWQP